MTSTVPPVQSNTGNETTGTPNSSSEIQVLEDETNTREEKQKILDANAEKFVENLKKLFDGKDTNKDMERELNKMIDLHGDIFTMIMDENLVKTH